MHQPYRVQPLSFDFPSQFKKFEPVCETNELDKGKQQEVVNAYDNSIVFTDYVTANLIDILSANTKFDTALMFISDHGESLGRVGSTCTGPITRWLRTSKPSCRCRCLTRSRRMKSSTRAV